MSNDKDTNYWQEYEAKRKEDSEQNQRARGKSLDKNLSSKSLQSTELLQQRENQLKDDKKELKEGIKHIEKIKSEKAEVSKDHKEKTIKKPVRQPDFNQDAWKKAQEDKQKAIDTKVNKSEPSSKSSFVEKVQKLFNKTEVKPRDKEQAKVQTPQKMEQSEKPARKSLAQKIKQDFKPVKKEAPAKAVPKKKTPTKSK